MSVGGDGQWVRTHNKESAEAFVAEQQMEAGRLQARRVRAEQARKRAWAFLQGLTRRTQRR